MRDIQQNFANPKKVHPSCFKDMDMITHQNGVEPTQNPKNHTKDSVESAHGFMSLVKDISEVCRIVHALIPSMRPICLIVEH